MLMRIAVYTVPGRVSPPRPALCPFQRARPPISHPIEELLFLEESTSAPIRLELRLHRGVGGRM